MPRFFTDVTDASPEFITISGGDARHIALALRMRVGDALTVCDFERREYSCVLTEISPELVTARVVSLCANTTELPYRARLYQALPKGERADLIIQKSVECGVYSITFFESERCVARLSRESSEARKDRKLERFRAIAAEAAKQCGRGILPRIEFKKDLAEILKSTEIPETSFKLICYEGDEKGEYPTEKLGALLDRLEAVQGGALPEDISYIIGPEGGFSVAEVAAAVSGGFLATGLGRRILRCETASPFFLSCLSMRYELGG